MVLYRTPEEKAEGKERVMDRFDKTRLGQTRRDFLKTTAGVGAGAAIGFGAYYFGYKRVEKPLKVGLIGAGDEGGVLIGFHNPAYTEVVAVSDIRPSNMAYTQAEADRDPIGTDRIFHGDLNSDGSKKTTSPRKGLEEIYGKPEARKNIKRYVDYKELLKDPEVEAVIIALPLHLHAPVAIEAMDAGKHVFCEKLMARYITECKEMVRAARRNKRVLAIGHQRHYSLLYQHCLEIVKSGELGEIKHIRALWHRNNAWPRLGKDGKPLKEGDLTILRDSWRKSVPEVDAKALAANLTEKYGYKDMEELIRWRLYSRTGGGLMAELGSHQLDASSIFLGKVKPLAVSGVGGKYFYEDDREVADHVFTTFEFPDSDYWQDGVEFGSVKDPNDRVVLTYSSINTNSFEPYGECLMGQHATLVVEQEQEAFLYPERNPNAKKDAKSTKTAVKGAGGTAAETSGSTGYVAQEEAKKVLGGPVSRGYTEELEDFAYCCRMHDQESDDQVKALWREGPAVKGDQPRGPRCHGVVAMADAIMALTSNLAMDSHMRIEFKKDWFEVQEDKSSEVNPEDDPQIKAALQALAKANT